MACRRNALKWATRRCSSSFFCFIPPLYHDIRAHLFCQGPHLTLVLSTSQNDVGFVGTIVSRHGHPERCVRHWNSTRKLAAFIRFRTDTWICRSYSTIFHFLNVFRSSFMSVFHPRAHQSHFKMSDVSDLIAIAHTQPSPQTNRNHNPHSKSQSWADKTLHSTFKWQGKRERQFQWKTCFSIFWNAFVSFHIRFPTATCTLLTLKPEFHAVADTSVTIPVVRDLTHVLSCPFLH